MLLWMHVHPFESQVIRLDSDGRNRAAWAPFIAKRRVAISSPPRKKYLVVGAKKGITTSPFVDPAVRTDVWLCCFSVHSYALQRLKRPKIVYALAQSVK